jgi:quercetin dioxygenase-like cupin family protein
VVIGAVPVIWVIGRVRLAAGEHSWEGRQGDLVVVPSPSHSLEALEDSAALLTVANLPRTRLPREAVPDDRTD